MLNVMYKYFGTLVLIKRDKIDTLIDSLIYRFYVVLELENISFMKVNYKKDKLII